MGAGMLGLMTTDRAHPDPHCGDPRSGLDAGADLDRPSAGAAPRRPRSAGRVRIGRFDDVSAFAAKAAGGVR